MLVEALKTYGLRETPGPASAQWILDMAKEVGGWIADWYQADATPWCGLWMAAIAMRAGKPVNLKNPLAALSWAEWGDAAERDEWNEWRPELGDVLVFTRKGGGHVGLYVGETPCGQWFYVLGGNQSDSVNIMRISRGRLAAARRLYRIGKPANVRPVFILPAGEAVSTNEA
ncbi:MAG: TIGR02594 family protein [Pseudomonadota bacterium]